MTADNEWLKVESLDLEAQGVAHDAEGKVVFIEGALPGETVQVHVNRRKNQWEQATLTALRARERAARAARLRALRPACRRLRRLQDAAPSRVAQVAVKQRALEDSLWHLGKVRPELVLRPIEGPAWGYRNRARLSVRHVVKKGARAGRLSRAQVELHRRHADLRRAAAAGERNAAAASGAGDGDGRAAIACRRSSLRWATACWRWCCATSSR